VTIAEMAAATGAGSGNENYWNDGTRTVGTAAPAVNISLYEAMKYCNYLTSGNVNNGVYTFVSGFYSSTMSRSAIMAGGLDSVATDANKIYALPTEDEWYKAAYYKPDDSGYSLYANGTGIAPGVETDSNYGGTGGTYSGTWIVGTGTEEQNGTDDMMGNVWEWMEDSAGVFRGGSYGSNETILRSSYRYDYDPSSESYRVGFRPVEVVPEPATIGMVGLVGALALLIRRRFLS